MTNSKIKLTTYSYDYGQEENRLTIKCEDVSQAGAIKYLLSQVGVTFRDDRCTKTLQIRLPKANIVGK